MTQMEQILRIAEEALSLRSSNGVSERWLWDRACRIAKNTEFICQMPEIQNKGESLEKASLIAAAYFSDSGLRLYTDVKGIPLNIAHLELRGRELRDFSVQVINEKIGKISNQVNIDRICRILTESENRRTRMLEAQILSDARNLDEMGAVGLVYEIRRCLLQGKSLSSLLEGWKRKVEYRYWEARLKEDFHFHSVRLAASQRFSAAQQCIMQLESESRGADLQGLKIESFKTVS